MQDVLLTDGVYVFSSASGHCAGSHSAWTAVTTPKSFAPDVDRSNTDFKPTAADNPTQN